MLVAWLMLNPSIRILDDKTDDSCLSLLYFLQVIYFCFKLSIKAYFIILGSVNMAVSHFFGVIFEAKALGMPGFNLFSAS